MEEDKGKKKHRYTYYTATGKEEIEVDENWYGILRQADKDTPPIQKSTCSAKFTKLTMICEKLTKIKAKALKMTKKGRK